MKIYFEDGKIRDLTTIPIQLDFVINAGDGVENNILKLNKIYSSSPSSIVYTNSIFGLDNKYAWNSELQVPEIYIRNNYGVFTRIDKLTNRELRQSHNIAKMYIAGEFDDTIVVNDSDIISKLSMKISIDDIFNRLSIKNSAIYDSILDNAYNSQILYDLSKEQFVTLLKVLSILHKNNIYLRINLKDNIVKELSANGYIRNTDLVKFIPSDKKVTISMISYEYITDYTGSSIECAVDISIRSIVKLFKNGYRFELDERNY